MASNNVVPASGFSMTNAPARVQGRTEVSATAKALMGSGFNGKRISIKGGVFRLIVGGKEIAAMDERFLDTVIVRAADKIGRTFYATAFDEDQPATSPDCWSADGEKPDPSSPAKQSANCASCPQNAKGSGKDDTRACRFSQKLALVLANDIEGDVMAFTAPAASIFGKEEGENRPLQSYARFLAANKINPEEVITRMRFDTKASAPKLFFKPMRWLTDEEFEICQKQGQTEDAKMACTMTVSQVDGTKQPALPAPAKSAAVEPAGAQAAAAPQQAADDEPPPPAPGATRKGKKGAPATEGVAPAEPTVRTKPDASPPVVAKPDVAKLVQQWDD